jgi:hypothetical protein
MYSFNIGIILSNPASSVGTGLRNFLPLFLALVKTISKLVLTAPVSALNYFSSLVAADAILTKFLSSLQQINDKRQLPVVSVFIFLRI